MNLAAIAESLPNYLHGLVTTVELLALSLGFGLAGAVPLAVARASNVRWLSAPVWAFTFVIRGTPMLVQLFLVYYGLAQFEAVRASVFWPWLASDVPCNIMMASFP